MTPRAHTAERLQRGTNSIETPYRSLVEMIKIRWSLFKWVYEIDTQKNGFFTQNEYISLNQ